jgi:hypothetical protein
VLKSLPRALFQALHRLAQSQRAFLKPAFAFIGLEPPLVQFGLSLVSQTLPPVSFTVPLIGYPFALIGQVFTFNSCAAALVSQASNLAGQVASLISRAHSSMMHQGFHRDCRVGAASL